MTTEDIILAELKSVRADIATIRQTIELLTVNQVADLMKVTPKHVYSLIKSAGFPPQIKIGTSSRWKLSEVEAWLNHDAQRSA